MNNFKYGVAVIVTLFISLVGFSQCNTTNFTVTKVNGTCFSNGSITVVVPTSTDCSAWVAEIVKTAAGSTPIALTIPTTGGNVLFSSLTAGSYNISLSNGFTTVQYASNPVVLTSSYVNMSVSSTSNPPVCTNSSPGYAPNGTLTANVTGGTGPFFYQLVTSFSTQTGTSASRLFTFNNVPGGEQVNLQVTDQVNGTAGCENTITQTPTTVAQTAADLRYGFRAYNFVRECSSCTTAKLFINLDNLTTARRDILIQPGNAKITIAGVDYPLTYIPAQNRFTYDPVATGGPSLTHGLPITTTFNWGCKILTRTNTVDLNNNFLNVFPTVLMNPDCSFRYQITVIGDSDNTNTGFTDRNIYFCESNTVVIERRISTSPDVWQVVSGSNITPDPATLTNDLNVVGALTASIPSAARAFFVYQTGVYKVTATDACHSVSRTITITDNIPINSLNAVSKTSVLSGTVGFEVPTNSFTGQYPLTVKIERVDGQTSMPINAAGPLSSTGNYTINFPITRTFNANPAWFNILDLPPGNYRIEYSDGCTAATGNKKIQTINLTNVAGYNPQFSVVEGCSNSNSIGFNLNPNANTFLPTFTQLRTPSGTLLQSIAGTSGVFNNVASGNYILNFTTSGASGAAFSAALNAFAPFNYTKSITVAPFQNYSITTSSILCDLNDSNSGIVSAQAYNGTIIYPLSFSLFSTSNTTTPIQGPFIVSSPITSYVFTNVPVGNYFVRVTSACFSLDKNLTVSSVSTVPTAQVTNPTICPGSPTTVAIISATNNLYDITWTDNNGNVVGTGMPITLAPSVTTTYTATFALKPIFGCTNSITYQSNVTVTVTPDPNLGLSVSDINLCDGTSPSITISNTQNAFSYEIVDANGTSFSPPLLANGNGGSVTIAIPNTITLVIGQIFKVKATNGNAGCMGLLTDVSNVLSGTFNITCPTFSTSTVQCYTDLPSQTSYTIAQFQALGNGDGIIDVVGCGVIEITATNGANPGCNANVIRTYTITEYVDSNDNDVRDLGENTVLNTTTCSQTNNINDTTSPIVTGTLTASNTNGCLITDAPAAMTTVSQLEAVGLTISDNCTTDVNLVVTSSDGTATGTCPITFVRTYTITDVCGNSTTKTQTININDTTAPVVTGTIITATSNGCSVADAPIAMATVSQLEAAGLTISDNCTTDVNLVVTSSDGTATGMCPITFTRTYTITDACNNTTTATQTITINDTTAPVVTGTLTASNINGCSIADAPVALTSVAALEAAGLSISDNCTTDVNLVVTSSDGTASGTCPITFTRTYTIKDACNNATTATQTITINDTTSPVVTGTLTPVNANGCSIADAPTAMTTVAALEVSGLTISDNCTTDVNLVVTSSDGTASGTCPITFTRTYTIKDACNNATTATQTITINDTTSPVVTGTLTASNINGCSIVDAPTAMTTVAALEVSGLTISDNCTTDVNLVVTSSDGTASGTCPITFTRTYTIKDACNNATTATQTIIINDTTVPVVTGTLTASNINGCSIADAPIAMTTVAALEIAGLSISDNCTTDVNLVVTSSDGTASGTCPITFTRTYTIKDACNNATTATQTITINDTIAPVVTGTLTSVNISGCPLTDPSAAMTTVAALELAGVTISDNCSTDANLVVTSIDSNATGICPIVFTRTYTIKDACNNAVTTTQTITISDTTPPDFSGILPQNITLECNQTIPSASILTATDNCTSVVTVNFTEQNIQGTCPNNYSIIRTWVATDICGNSQAHTQQITIQDTTPPVFVGSFPTIEVFAKCDGIPAAPVLTATDNCGSATVTYSEVKIDGDCTNKYRLERTWTATDSCGNETEITQTVYLACYVTPYNALSPDGDGLNDVFIIEGLECYPNNTVQIVNRWGVTVFEAAYYDNVNNVFRGFSDGRSTVSRNDKLPTGNYWYILKYEYDLYGRTKENIEKIGYIYIQNE
jgi:gliding motility-associated-like protein